MYTSPSSSCHIIPKSRKDLKAVLFDTPILAFFFRNAESMNDLRKNIYSRKSGPGCSKHR